MDRIEEIKSETSSYDGDQ